MVRRQPKVASAVPCCAAVARLRTFGDRPLQAHHSQPVRRYLCWVGDHAAVDVCEGRGKDHGLALHRRSHHALVVELGAAAVGDVIQVGGEHERAVAVAVRTVDVPGVEAFAGLVPLDLRRILQLEAAAVAHQLLDVAVDEAGDFLHVGVEPEFAQVPVLLRDTDAEVGAALPFRIDHRLGADYARQHQVGRH